MPNKRTFGLIVTTIILFELAKPLPKMWFLRHAREAKSPLAASGFAAGAVAL
jgi:hypothetical protein